MSNLSELSIAQKRALLARLVRQDDGNDDVPYPLSYGQRALWLHSQLSPQSSAYNIYVTLRIHSEIDPTAWQRAVSALVQRHPILATTFTTYNGHPIALPPTRETTNALLEMHDISGWSQEVVSAFLQATSRQPFDLAQHYPFRCLLLTASAQEHILLFVVHHIVVDGWTLSLLLRDLLFLATDPSSLPPASRTHYRHFVRWQRNLLAGTRGQQLRDYWQRQLAGTLPAHSPLDLLFDRPRPPIWKDHVEAVALPIGSQTPRLREFAAAEHITLYTLLLACFMLLLYHYSRQEDILIASPMSGRSSPEFAQVAGYFANLVVLRAHISDQFGLRQFFDQLQQTVLEAVEHQDYPFSLLVEQLQSERDPGLPPLTTIAFAMESQALDKGNLFPLVCEDEGYQLQLGGLRLEAFSRQLLQEGAFDLTLMVFEHEKRLNASFQYNADLFEEATIARMAQHFLTLLQNMLANPQQQIAETSLLSQDERTQLLVTYNQTQRAIPQNLCIHQHFEQIAARAPAALALESAEGRLTYGELDQRANRLAHTLRSQGVGPDILVGVCLPRSLDLLICLLAILKAGGAYVPLDPSLPAARLALMIEEGPISLVLTRSHERAQLPRSRPGLRLLVLDEEDSALGKAERPPQNTCLPAHLAYVIYTSGTSGHPKGVALTHLGWLNLTLELQRFLHLQGGTRVIQCASLAFDASLLEFTLALFTGGCLYLPPSPLPLGAALVNMLDEQAIDLAFFTPSLLSTLPAAPLPNLKTLLVGGEACPLELIRTWSRGRTCYNLYGPTEVTVFSSYARCTPEQTSIHLGRPIANMQHYVLDARMQPVPIGVPGELYIGGCGLARGYLGQPALTAQRFLPNPFSPGERLYRTGDRVRWRSDGTLEFLGRADQQIKLRGHRIEPAEIEAVLCRQPGVRACLVTLDSRVPNDPRLVAYLVLDTPAPTMHDLLEALRQHLPAYMLPSYFVPLAALPLNTRGKADRNALPPPTERHLVQTRSSTPPQTATARLLAEIWQNVLGLTEIHNDDDFFELGGHSLLLTHLATEIQDRFDLLLPLSTFIEHSTLAALADAIDQQLNLQAQPQHGGTV